MKNDYPSIQYETDIFLSSAGNRAFGVAIEGHVAGELSARLSSRGIACVSGPITQFYGSEALDRAIDAVGSNSRKNSR